jgi:hypothetical protein
LSAASFYVYYKVEIARLDDLRRAVKSMFAALESEHGVRGRWLRRRDDPATYMEVYEGVPDARRFEEQLARASERHGVCACIASGSSRRTEIFVAAH